TRNRRLVAARVPARRRFSIFRSHRAICARGGHCVRSPSARCSFQTVAWFLLPPGKASAGFMNELNEIEHAAGADGVVGRPALAVGSTVAGRYVLLAHLGGGRFGPVFEAVDRALSGAGPERERRVALHAI